MSHCHYCILCLLILLSLEYAQFSLAIFVTGPCEEQQILNKCSCLEFEILPQILNLQELQTL